MLDLDSVLAFIMGIGNGKQKEERDMEAYLYEKQSIITHPGQYEHAYATLPDEPEQLLRIVQRLIIHADLGKLYGVTFSKRQLDEELLRTVPQMLNRILGISNEDLSSERTPNLRMVGMCRDYALLMVSFLRHKNIPARVRAGFANYFDSEIEYEDQWLIEYYSNTKKRWIRMDAQVDLLQKEHYGITFNTLDMPKDSGFLLGGEAWKLCRQGMKHQEDFGYNKNWKGWSSVKGNLLHDFNCLLGLELMPWDLWTELSTKKYSELTKEEKYLLDEMAEVTSNPDVTSEQLECIIEQLPKEYMESIRSQLKILGIEGKTQTLDPDKLEEKAPILKKEYRISDKEEVKDELKEIVLKGGRQNNLKNVHVSIPKQTLTVITGVSGSGKSSLAFDTIFAEGKRRYLDNMSGAAKMQEQVEKPDFDSLQGLTPTIAIEQKKGSQNPRSTVGTLTGILDQLRMLYVAIGKPHCPFCGKELVKAQKNKNQCPVCKTYFQKLTASTFNANSHVGACHECNGLGTLFEVDENAIFLRDDLSVLDGASDYFGKLRGKKRTGNWMVGELYAIAEDRGIDLDIPWKNQPESFKRAVLYGTGENKIYQYHYKSGGRDTMLERPAQGAVSHIQRLFRESKSDDNPYIGYMKKMPCPVCAGEQLSIEARYTTILGYRLPELLQLPIKDLLDWCVGIQEQLSDEDKQRAGETFHEIEVRIANLLQVGLPYLTLARTAPTLSGGELQRVRLSSQLGSDLVGLTYILDEPSIGLHPRDHHLMIQTMKRLRDKGNTVIVVEHDKDTMLNADHIIDVGPGAGVYGGQIIAEGSVEEIKDNPNSITGEYLREKNHLQSRKRRVPKKWLELTGCNEHNLKNIDVKIPLETMCCIAGASGSGKSTLVFETLIPALEEHFSKKQNPKKNYDEIHGVHQINGFIEMDQAAIGKNSRSTPVTYLGIFDSIRQFYADLPDSRKRFFSDSHFSFNSKDGQCPVCEGLGQVKIAFQYMSDHYVTCPECKGKRYKEEILEVKYRDKSITDVLNMDVSEGVEFFKNQEAIASKLQLMNEVGLSYLKLGQSTVTLSGGEAQRLKLSKELGGKKKGHMLYILDEPTTGLHFKDINRLLAIFQKLVDAGNSLLIIEHNMDIVGDADWVIDVGPDGGVAGGRIVAEGSPEAIASNKESVTGRFL